MTLIEFYNSLGGDYDAAMRTLMNNNIATKFIIKFLNDPTYSELIQSFENGDTDTMFRNAHTLKGVSLNLAFKNLSEKAIILTDALRESSAVRNDLDVISKYLDDVKVEYNFVVDKINEFKLSNNL